MPISGEPGSHFQSQTHPRRPATWSQPRHTATTLRPPTTGVATDNYSEVRADSHWHGKASASEMCKTVVSASRWSHTSNSIFVPKPLMLAKHDIKNQNGYPAPHPCQARRSMRYRLAGGTNRSNSVYAHCQSTALIHPLSKTDKID